MEVESPEKGPTQLNHYSLSKAKHSKCLVTFDNLELVIKLCLKLIFLDYLNGFQHVLKSPD